MTTWTGCHLCGTSYILGTAHTCAIPSMYQQPAPLPLPAPLLLMGWQCPVCGTVYSPHMSACFKPHVIQSTGTSDG